VNAKDDVLAAAEKAGWHLDEETETCRVNRVRLSHTGVDVFIGFSRHGAAVASAVSYDPYFRLGRRSTGKRGRLLAWLADPATITPEGSTT
jgi:hypothetical protein